MKETPFRIASCLLATLTLTAQGQTRPGTLAALETRLYAAESVRIEFEVMAAGAVTADLRGRLHLERGGPAVLEATGRFAGEPVNVAMTADADNMLLRKDTADAQLTERPAALDDALLVGFVRMGVLHNIARLAAGGPPDHGEGGVRDWVTLAPLDEHDASLEFDLTVAGQPAGTATLSLDARGLPAHREQRVAFPEGEMRVTERYSSLDVTP